MSFQQNDETAAKTSQSLRRAAAFIKICAARSLSAGYLLCYRTGLFTIRFFRRTGRILGRLFRPAARLLCRGVDWLLLRHVRAIVAELKRFGQGFGIAGRRVAAAFRRHPLLAVLQVLMLPLTALRRHRKMAVSLLNLAAPVAACFVLASTLQYWAGKTFVLQLAYGGESMGYISKASVFDSAADMAVGRVINTDNSFEVERTPKFTITMAGADQVLDEKTLCDKILRSSTSAIAELSGLYIDGQFEGAVRSRAELEGVLQGILDSYSDGGEETLDFVQNVEVVDGLYPLSAVVSAQDMHSLLTRESVVGRTYEVVKGDSLSRIANKNDMTLKELMALNPGVNELVHIGQELTVQRAQPYLRVQSVRTVEYTEEIPFATEKVQDANQYTGYSKVKREGKAGERTVVAQVVEIDGVEQSRTILSETVTAEPVNKVLIVGSKKYNANIVAGDGIATGKFIWPIPACKLVTTKFGSGGHKGVDITGGAMNKPVIASDGGRVAEVNTSGYGGGYGKYVIIDHGGGYRTMYAHLNKVAVVKGQQVTRGQEIGLAGNTGRSYGAHLHFEIRRNGVPVNPLSYISYGK